MRQISLLNKLYLLFFPFFLLAFDKLYDLSGDEFEIVTTKDSYKLILNKQKFTEYSFSDDGFKFFLPYFTKEFNLKILRYNSIGYINGFLSMDKNFNHKLNVSSSNLKYYLTDYKKNNQKELEYLLKNFSIPYKKLTSLSIEMYNIPFKVSKNFNKYLYFKIKKLPKNKLEYISYSVYIVLDKKLVDKYTKYYFPKSKNLIKTFLKNINKVKPYYKEKKVKKSVEKTKQIKHNIPKFSLHFKRFFYMKEFGYIYMSNEIDIQNVDTESYKIVDKLRDLSVFLKKELNKNFILKPIYIYKNVSLKLDEINQKILNFKFLIKNKKCIFDKFNIKKECFKNPDYFQNYIYFSIKNNSLPQDEIILAYGDYRTFNDIAKYYYENSLFQKAEIYFNKAYILSDKHPITSHNLAVLYATSGINYYDPVKTLKYLKKSNFEIDYYNLGVYYYLGLGVKESDRVARYYFEKAKNIPFAKENLEIMNKYKIGLK